VDARDVAATGVAALVDDHAGREYTLTGPEPVTFARFVKMTKGTDSPVWRFKRVDEAGFYFRAQNRGWGERYIDTLNERFLGAVAGNAAEVTEDVYEALGREPIPVARFIRAETARAPTPQEREFSLPRSSRPMVSSVWDRNDCPSMVSWQSSRRSRCRSSSMFASILCRANPASARTRWPQT